MLKVGIILWILFLLLWWLNNSDNNKKEEQPKVSDLDIPSGPLNTDEMPWSMFIDEIPLSMFIGEEFNQLTQNGGKLSDGDLKRILDNGLH